MRLRDLDGHFLKIIDDAKGYQRVDSLAESDGVMFQCPKCSEGKERGEENGRRFVIGAHYITCWWSKIPLNPPMLTGPGRWNPSGTGLDDLTFVGTGAVSVLLTTGCQWHGHVANGDEK